MTKITSSLTILVLVLTMSVCSAGQTSANKIEKGSRPVSPAVQGDSDSLPSPKDKSHIPPTGLDGSVTDAVVSVTGDPDDHVPCFFTLKQLMDLRPIPSVAKLTDADESRVLTSVVQAVDSASETELTGEQKRQFLEELAKNLDGQLVGKTPGEALTTIMNILYSITQSDKVLGLDTGSKAAKEGSDKLNGTVVSSARTAIAKFARPDDIGCAYQIMSWDESRLLFGRSVANNFITVQVTVRNLNAKEEFIVHNAMLSVDTDINGAIGRYFEGEDKIGVEAYNNAGEALTKRGIVGNTLSAASTLLSVLQPIVSANNFSNAVAAFTGGVVPGWKKMSPDHQKDQLLLIANSGFSATYTTKTVVGKSGAATFYTWFPAKPFLEGWWVQDCAQEIAASNPPSNGSNSPQLPPNRRLAQTLCSGVPVSKWKTTAYKDWSSVSDQIFRDLSLAVVAGIHVQEDSKNKSSITDIKCPNNSEGDIDLSRGSSDGTISCDISGDNLDKVSKLRLENASNAVDPARPEATVNVSGDDTTAIAKFKISDLASATGDTYNVFAVGKDGTETSTGQKIHLDSKTVTLTAIKPDTIDLANRPSSIDLTGYHMNNLTYICLSPPDSAASRVSAPVSPISATEATASLASLSIFPGKWEIYLGECGEQPTDSGKPLPITGKPIIDSFTPKSGRASSTFAINGSVFHGATTVDFGGTMVTPSKVENSKITLTVPPGARPGPVTITVNTPTGDSAPKEGFTVLPPPKPAKPKPVTATKPN